MGNRQPQTPMQTDNSTTLGVVTNKIQPKRTKAMDMRFHWLRCRANQRQFQTYWRAGPTNKGDYVTKHHAALHHKNVRADYLTPNNRLEKLRHHIQAKITGLASRVTKVARASFTKSAARVCYVWEAGLPNYLDTAGIADHGRQTDESPRRRQTAKWEKRNSQSIGIQRA